MLYAIEKIKVVDTSSYLTKGSLSTTCKYFSLGGAKWTKNLLIICFRGSAYTNIIRESAIKSRNLTIAYEIPLKEMLLNVPILTFMKALP